MEVEHEKRRGRPPKAPPEPMVQRDRRVLVTHYKIYTSQGRFLAGDRPYLPEHEAVDLVEVKQHAKYA